MKFHTLVCLATAASLLAAGGVVAQPKVKAACAADVQKMCPSATPGRGYVMRCLKGRMSEASPGCQSAMQAAKAMRAQRKAAAAAAQPAPAAGAPAPQ